MVDIINALVFLWFIRTIKFVLFWIYLWQLKEYHIGRFVDHFKTYKGKKLIFNWLLGIKIMLLPLLFIRPGFIVILLPIYIFEDIIFGFGIIKRNIKKPKVTFKTILLMGTVFIGVSLYLFLAYNYHWSAIALLVFDILIPIIVSLVVLCFQPFFVVARNNILKKASRKIAGYDHLIVIGITGSYGKTSTKEFLTTILSSKFNVLSTPQHKNSEMGIAKTILEDLKPEHKIFIVEMGAYQKGGIKLLCDMVKPDIGIVTGVNEQHLATFVSLENLLSAEGGRELTQCLPSNGLIVINGDNPYCLELYKNIYKYRGRGLRKMAYTLKKDKIDSDIWTEDIIIKKEVVSFIARTHDKEMIHFNVAVLGKQQVQNILGAILVAKTLGMSMEQIQQACKNIVPEQAGATLKTGIHGINIIDSSYSSNPDGVMADLDYLSIFPNKKVIVMPCLIELGSKSIKAHIDIGEKIAKICDMAIITTKDKFKEIKMGAVAGGMPEKDIIFCENPKEILTHITTFCKQGDAVLLEGRVPGELIRLLDDKEKVPISLEIGT